MPPLAVVLIVIGFACGAAALVKTLRSKESPPPRKVPLILSNAGMLFIVAAGVVFYFDKQ
ncbi:hypothetical protein OL239_08735 [Arthrobacter sp. ATA002]|uniref:hypothetical protein n=1 Tax=Arthrobacter sp. ATA002 TaxID=2991715 RepID=UPI0022A7F982|nr:hypothetical protein [Arthrobacter sp. ATA002]WAP53128.1 hypothetical protein OL239_08735 [Arthrobacter sp. ATA002]